MTLRRDNHEYRPIGPMTKGEKKIITSILGYFVLVAFLVAYMFFFSGVLL